MISLSVRKKDILAKHADGSKKISKKAAAKLKIEPVERVHMCIIFEMLMRHHTLQNNDLYIMSLEEANASRATSITIGIQEEGDRKKWVYTKK